MGRWPRPSLRPWPPTVALALALIAALATGCSSSGAATKAGALSWKACGGPFQCAKLAVPLDYSAPADGTIKLALIRLPATSDGGADLVVNPGGPGASGIDFLRGDYAAFPAKLRAHFNIVSFDPRGVGESDPVRCENGAALEAFIGLDPDPSTPSEIAAALTATRRFDASCLADSGKALLENVSTQDTARDMDRIRVALGQAKLNYLGFSYGTFLGATYAGLFPTHVRAIALDGALDPDLTIAQLDLQQAKGFEVDLDDFLDSCQTSPSCPLRTLARSRKVTVKQAFAQALTRIGSGAPLPTSSGSRTLSEGEGYLGMIAALYSSSTWNSLAQGLVGVLRGDGTALLNLADAYNGRNANGTYSNELAANTAINCLDYPAPSKLSTYEADAVSFAKQAPVFGASQAWAPLSCTYWPVPPTGHPQKIAAVGAPPIVVVGTTADPATPYADARALAAQLSSGVLITHKGVGHTAYFDSSCVRSAVDAYLIDLTVPHKGLVCGS